LVGAARPPIGQASNGFQWTGDPDESYDWMIRFADRGLREIS
jgi:hypothetical protein